MTAESYVSAEELKDFKAYGEQVEAYVDALANMAVELAWGIPLSPLPPEPIRPSQESIELARALLTSRTPKDLI